MFMCSRSERPTTHGSYWLEVASYCCSWNAGCSLRSALAGVEEPLELLATDSVDHSLELRRKAVQQSVTMKERKDTAVLSRKVASRVQDLVTNPEGFSCKDAGSGKKHVERMPTKPKFKIIS